MNELRELAYRLKQARESSGLTQAELGERINVSVTSVSGYEIGRIVPSLEVLVKFATATNSSADFLLGLTEKISASTSINQLITIASRLSKRDFGLLLGLAKALNRA